MVTSNKLPDKKVVKMSEQKNNAVVPQRTLLGEVNEHITCPLCRGYYIDATTIVECLHSFCRSCIIKHLQTKSYCPVCEMMINSAKPNIKLDKALQDIVYKLVPGLFQREMDRRQQFYASRPGPAASATPEQRGEDTERIIFSPEDVISFSLEFADATDTDSISSKSSDSNEPQNASSITRRYLQCPAVVNISHLKKFLSMKFDIDSTQFAIDILYKRVPLPDYYTLMDIAYIYNWKRNEPMRFFYQIIDYVAIRNRLFDINRKETHFGDRKSSPTSTEDTNVSSPAPNLNDQGSEASSGTDSPMPEDGNSKQVADISKKNIDKAQNNIEEKNSTASFKKSDDEEEKSQFLNSFELTAKNSANLKSPVKQGSNDDSSSNTTILTPKSNSPKSEDSLKRKFQIPPNTPEMKKLKIEIEKAKIPTPNNISLIKGNSSMKSDTPIKPKNVESVPKKIGTNQTTTPLTSATPKEEKIDMKQPISSTKHSSDTSSTKRVTPGSYIISLPKRKPIETSIITPPSSTQKTVSPLKIQVPRSEGQSSSKKIADAPAVKKMPDLKPSNMGSQSFSTKQPINKVRMDLLANNSDIDRSKILPQVKSPLGPPGAIPGSGDPLKSLFDSCKINIPSSLSITLTDQKLEARHSNDPVTTDPKKNVVNKNLVAASSNSNTHKIPSPPVHNYIQILKLPDSDPKKVTKTEETSDSKVSHPNKTANKIETNPGQPKPGKSSEVSAKGPIPNLKPIADTKLAKQSGNFSSPITFQQTFEQQLQSLQSDKKPKVTKNKPLVPKLVPATPKSLSAVNKPSNPTNKPSPSSTTPPETKTGSALDLSTTNNMPSQLGQQPFDKAFETMQSIANLAKKQNLQSKGSAVMSQNNVFSAMSNRPLNSGASPLRIPTTNTNQVKSDKALPTSPHTNNVHTRQDIVNKNNTMKSINNVNTSVASPTLPTFVGSSHSSPNTQPSPRQTRSPSSSPKLVIAEEKHVSNSLTDQQTGPQSTQLLNTQIPIMSLPKSESSKSSPGPSKPGLKPVKPLTPVSKIPTVRPPQTPNMKQSPMLNNSEYHALLRHQFEMNWLTVQRQYDMYKNTLNPPPQGDFNKDKQ